MKWFCSKDEVTTNGGVTYVYKKLGGVFEKNTTAGRLERCLHWEALNQTIFAAMSERRGEVIKAMIFQIDSKFLVPIGLLCWSI